MSTTATGNFDGKSRVLQAVDIVELIGQTVKLKRRGTKFVGLCPFHTEKTPSFTVDPGKQFFHCFGCKAGGNVIDFVMKRDRIEFVEALQLLARQANIDLPRSGNGGADKQKLSERQVLLDAHSAACGLFEKLLSHPQHGQAARAYLAQRGFTDETLQRFQVGLTLDSWDLLLKSQAMKRFAPPALLAAGLVKARESGGGMYDTFRNRIMFPIRDEQGRIIAFGGRIVPGSQDPAKYLNSPETPLFSKSRSIYGLDFAKQRIVETRTVAVVEGYTDVLMAHQCGATNVVSVLGTAMTPQHVGILKRFADRIVLLFDPDTAGDLAVNRAVELFLTQNIELAIAAIPDGLDPDEFLLAKGAEAFEQLLAGASDALTYKWRQLLRDFGSSDDLTSQQRALEQYLEVLAGARGSGPVDSLRWGATLTRVSRLTGIPVEELNRRFRVNKKPPPRFAAATQAANDDEPKTTVPRRRQLNAQDRAETWILGALLAGPGRWTNVQQFIGPADFGDPLMRRIAEVYWDYQRDEGEPAFSELLALLPDTDLKEQAVALLETVESMEDIDQAVADSLELMRQAKRRQVERKLVADLRRTNDSSHSSPPQDYAAGDASPAAADERSNVIAAAAVEEIELLRKLQEHARQPDLRRTSS